MNGNPRIQGSADDALQGIQVSAHLVHFPSRRSAVGQNSLPGGGEPNTLMGGQQLYPQLPFYGADSLGQGRLGDVQLVRCLCNVSAVRQRLKQLEILFVPTFRPFRCFPFRAS